MDYANLDKVSASPFNVISPLEFEDWDEIVAKLPQHSFFHGRAWAEVLRDTYGFSPIYLVSGTPRDPRALMPIMEVASWLTGRRGIGLPFTDECSPLFHETEKIGNLFAEARGIGRQRGWRYLELRGGMASFSEAKPSTSFLGHSVKLGINKDSLLASFEPSTRRAIKKAEQSGLKTTVSTDQADLNDFFRLLCITRRRHGLPVQPYSFFANIHRSIIAKRAGLIFIAKKGNTPIAGAVYFHFGSTSLYKYGASDEQFQELRANNLIMWEAIKWHNDRKFIKLDFGRTSLRNSGLRRFKLGWGATERNIDYLRYDLGRGEFSSVQDEATGWYNALFSRLPVPLSRIAGSLLYKHAA